MQHDSSFDEDGEEMKQSEMVAKKARAHEPFDARAETRGGTASFWPDMVEQHFHALTASYVPKAEKDTVQQVCDTTLGEYMVCSRPRDTSRGVHACVVRKDMYTGSADDRVLPCGCSLDMKIFPVVHIRSVADMERMETEWQEALAQLEDLISEINRLDHSGRETHARIAERSAWIRFCIAAYDSVRSHVVRMYRKQLDVSHGSFDSEDSRAQAVLEAGGPTLPRYVHILVKFNHHLQSRVVRDDGDAKKKGDHTAISKVFCFKHKKIGHLLPLYGYRAYDASCFICPAEQSIASLARVQNSVPIHVSDAAAAATTSISREEAPMMDIFAQ